MLKKIMEVINAIAFWQDSNVNMNEYITIW